MIAWLVLTLSSAIAKPLSRRTIRSTENDHLPKIVDDSLASPFMSFHVPGWLQIYQPFFSNFVDENILPELKETNIEVSAFKPRETILENSVELSQSEDIGESNILANDGISEWERNNINTELDAVESGEPLDVSDDAGTHNNELGQSVELDDDSLISVIGTPWGMIQTFREMAEEINNYEIETHDDRQSDALENLQEKEEFNVPDNELENLDSDNMVTFEDINSMLNDDYLDNTMDTDTLTGLDVNDVHENALESNSIDDRDSTLEVADMEIPSAETENNDLLESEGVIDSTPEFEGIDVRDGVENIIAGDSTAEIGGIEEINDGLPETEILDVGDSADTTLEIGGMEFPKNEDNGIEMPDIVDTPDSTVEIGGMEFPTGVNTPDDTHFSPEVPSVMESAELGFDSGVELQTLNDEIHSEVSVLPDEFNLDKPSVTEGSILNDENKIDLPQIDDIPTVDFSSELPNSVEDLNNDEPVT